VIEYIRTFEEKEEETLLSHSSFLFSPPPPYFSLSPWGKRETVGNLLALNFPCRCDAPSESSVLEDRSHPGVKHIYDKTWRFGKRRFKDVAVRQG
jgi:hypothetical protein